MTIARHAAGPAAGPLASRLADAGDLRRYDWVDAPTPVERAAWLDAPRTRVWIKRDDASSPIYGGGKVRKLQWVLANAPYDDGRPILSVGGTGSHHLLALALFLRPLQRELHALVFEQTWTPHVRRNFAVLVSSGTRLWPVTTRARLPWAWLAYRLWRRPPILGVQMPAGASTALGCFGFVEAALELRAQIDAGVLPRPEVIYVTAGSAGTCAGLALGCALAGLPVTLQLVSSVEAWAFNRVMFGRMIGAAHEELRRRGLPEAQRGSAAGWLRECGIGIAIDHHEVGGGYGVPTPQAIAAESLAREHGLRLETTYTAKCLAALQRIEGAHRGRPRDVLWWNTHGGRDLSAEVDPDWRARSPIAIPDEG
ncbi:MAG: pyridoxal-phosphate dependent enzyme [Deltaproteobacteria bacterium]|nr:pyridoxal-phosphate dependent enzyme [Deltaproteobacteria bacterium]